MVLDCTGTFGQHRWLGDGGIPAAGELTATVFHIAARSLAAQGLSIFGDHSDVMAARATGFAMLASSSVQEAMDLALVAHASTLAARIPFLHFFDGFRTSHELQKIETVDDEVVRAMIDERVVSAARARGLSPDRPALRGILHHDDAPRLVYADWLGTHGDPRGEFIALQCRRASLPTDDRERSEPLSKEAASIRVGGRGLEPPTSSV